MLSTLVYHLTLLGCLSLKNELGIIKSNSFCQFLTNKNSKKILFLAFNSLNRQHRINV